MLRHDIDYNDAMQEFLSQIVVVDVAAQFVYLGRLENIGDHTLTLADADVHDLRDSNTTRERYVLDARMHGLQPNRKRVFVAREQVVSVSLLEDVLAS